MIVCQCAVVVFAGYSELCDRLSVTCSKSVGVAGYSGVSGSFSVSFGRFASGTLAHCTEKAN